MSVEDGSLSLSKGPALRIAFLTPWRIDDPKAWSGIILPMREALEGEADVVAISTSDVRAAFIDRLAARLLRRLYLWDFGIATSRKRGRIANQRIAKSRADVVFAVAASVDVAYLPGTLPIVQYIDAGFDDMKDGYPVFTGLSRLSSVQIRQIGKGSGRRTAAYVAASDWAADGLVASGVPTSRVAVVPPGAAILPNRPNAARSLGPLRALVVASDWHRKGVDRAIAAVEAARARGAAIDLTIVGHVETAPDWVLTPGNLSAEELSSEYSNSDVLLELARANAAGVTLTDAAMHGLPAIATATGGVPSIVIPECSGWLVPNDDSVTIEVTEMLVRIADGDWGLVSRETVSEWADSRFDWSQWGRQVAEICAREAARGEQ